VFVEHRVALILFYLPLWQPIWLYTILPSPRDFASRYRFTYNLLLSFLLARWLASTSCFSSVLPTPLLSLHATLDFPLQTSNPLGLTQFVERQQTL
jgi:hypothetical protein